MWGFKRNKRKEIIDNNFNYINPIIMLQNYVADTILSKGYEFTCEEDNMVELYNTNIKPILKPLLRTVIETNVKQGSTYVYIDEKLAPQLINPTWPIKVWKDNAGKLEKIEFTIRQGQEGLTSQPITFTIDKKKVMSNGETIRVHNLGFVPVVEGMLKKKKMFSAWGLPNFINPYQFFTSMSDDNNFASYEFDSVYTPLYASAGMFHKSFNVAFNQFFKSMECSLPRTIITSASNKKMDELSNHKSKKDIVDEVNYNAENFTSIRGQDVKVDFTTPNTKLNEFNDTISKMFQQWFTMMGLEFQLSYQGNNKTQAEIEAKGSLQENTIDAIITALESFTEEFIDMYSKMYSLIKNQPIKVSNVDDTDFCFEFGKDVSAQTVDSVIKLVQAKIYSIAEGRALVNDSSIDVEKKLLDGNTLGEFAETIEPETTGGTDSDN